MNDTISGIFALLWSFIAFKPSVKYPIVVMNDMVQRADSRNPSAQTYIQPDIAVLKPTVHHEPITINRSADYITRIFFSVFRKNRFLLLFTVCAFLSVSGCGGGFSDDSDNAHHFQQSIFGTDTLE